MLNECFSSVVRIQEFIPALDWNVLASNRRASLLFLPLYDLSLPLFDVHLVRPLRIPIDSDVDTKSSCPTTGHEY